MAKEKDKDEKQKDAYGSDDGELQFDDSLLDELDTDNNAEELGN